MQQTQKENTFCRQKWLEKIGLNLSKKIYWNLSSTELIERIIQKKEGILSDQGAIVCSSGQFTGRLPQDRFIVKDHETESTVCWESEYNYPFPPDKFDALHHKMIQFLQNTNQDIYIRDAYAGVLSTYQISLRVITTLAWHNLFCHHLFLRPLQSELKIFLPEFIIIDAPNFQAFPEIDGTRSANFTIINLSRKIILIGGTGYAGEMKKGIFSILNYLLPQKHHILPMHCAVNASRQDGSTAIFFGLSGTGKTTISTVPDRDLIGDDEHGWYEEGIFNFEGGCYAKTVALSNEKEWQIFHAIKFGTILENMCFFQNTRTIDYNNTTITENMRAVYPIYHINHTIAPSVGPTPKNIFFLTCDAYGVLPPIAQLNREQAMYHFISGYTAKIAGTEMGILEPKMTFSACFGASFLPLHPVVYTTMLGEKLSRHQVSVWLLNTGWIGGKYGVGERINLLYTRTLVTAALSGALDHVPYTVCPLFGIKIPTSCLGIPSQLLNPKKMWHDLEAYNRQLNVLAEAFINNFKKYENIASKEIIKGGPSL